ncbi:MAG: SprT-like domain-containing protein [Hahellaceae bacterium]|nr:SprT-like domain-containing protein [Hahellaceae bacterium]
MEFLGNAERGMKKEYLSNNTVDFSDGVVIDRLREPPLYAAVRKQVEACLSIAESRFGRRFPRPEIRFDLRGRSAGQARVALGRHAQPPVLRFNAILLKENVDDFLREVPAHETAHLVIGVMYGRSVKPHGREWQAVMKEVFNIEPRVTHRMAVNSGTRRRFEYRCGCNGESHFLSTVRHNRIMAKTTQYRCRRCGDTLFFVCDNV